MTEAEERRAFFADEARLFRANELQRQLYNARGSLRSARRRLMLAENEAAESLRQINHIKRVAHEEGVKLA